MKETPILVTNSMILKELKNIERQVRLSAGKKLTDDLQEFTLAQASKLLKMSSETLRTKAEKLEIQCLVDERTNALDGITFKFTAEHIKNYQLKRIFKGKKQNKINEVHKQNINRILDRINF